MLLWNALSPRTTPGSKRGYLDRGMSAHVKHVQRLYAAAVKAHSFMLRCRVFVPDGVYWTAYRVRDSN